MKQIFIPTDAQAILSILLSARLLEDKLVWVYTPKGKFTVSSAYKLTFFFILQRRVWKDFQMGRATNLFGEEFGGYICQIR